MTQLEIIRLILGAMGGSAATLIVMLIRERNNFSTKVMDLFLQDKNSWVQEREKLEQRVDELYKKYDDLRDKYVDLATRQPTVITVQPEK